MNLQHDLWQKVWFCFQLQCALFLLVPLYIGFANPHFKYLFCSLPRSNKLSMYGFNVYSRLARCVRMSNWLLLVQVQVPSSFHVTKS